MLINVTASLGTRTTPIILAAAYFDYSTCGSDARTGGCPASNRLAHLREPEMASGPNILGSSAIFGAPAALPEPEMASRPNIGVQNWAARS